MIKAIGPKDVFLDALILSVLFQGSKILYFPFNALAAVGFIFLVVTLAASIVIPSSWR